MTWHALFYPLRLGTEETVKDLFKESGRPAFEVRDDAGNVAGRLLGTMAFVGAGTAIRAMEVHGPLPLVAAHLGRQPQIRRFEEQLEELLAEPRDMRSPDGARRFFQQAGMQSAHVDVGTGTNGDWHGWYFPLRPGAEDKVRALFDSYDGAGPRPGAMTFLGQRKALRLLERGSADAALDLELAERVAELATPAAGPAGIALECVIVRRHDLPVS
jgi:hypothetical protein